MPAILNLPASFDEDLEQFKVETDRFRQGAVSAAEYRSFRVPRGVYEQREADTYMLRARCPAGAVLPHQARALAAVSRRYGNGVLHVTTRQDIQVHRVLLNDLHPALSELHAAGLSTRGGGGNTVRNITGCDDGGVCAGLHGVARRVNDRLVPHYVVQVGGTVVEGQTQFAEGNQAVPARSVPSLLRELLSAFAASAQAPSFRDFLDAEGRQIVDASAQRYKHVPDFESGRDYYRDWGTETLFPLAGRGPGECGAGVFDLITVDLQSAREALGHQRLREAVVSAARALLVTRGQQANNETEALDLFRQYFVDERPVDAAAADLIARVRQARSDLSTEVDEVARFVATIENLYASMDASLRFRPPGAELPAPAADSATPPAPAAREADFRGVVCPLNYVKTKLVLGQMRSGEVLSVLLDEPGTRNVPESVRKDGHEVLSIGQEGEHWRVVIRKAQEGK